MKFSLIVKITDNQTMTGEEFMGRVDYCLEQQGKTRKDITRDLGISSSTMSSWAAGRGSVPNANAVAKIAEYLNVSTDLLITASDRDYVEFDKSKFPAEYIELAKDFLSLPKPFKDIIRDNIASYKELCGKVENGEASFSSI